MSPPHCQVLGSHDDYSITDFFPEGATVITQFRDPVDRFLSAYEFAVEIASRSFRLNRSEKKKGGDKGKENVEKKKDGEGNLEGKKDADEKPQAGEKLKENVLKKMGEQNLEKENVEDKDVEMNMEDTTEGEGDTSQDDAKKAKQKPKRDDPNSGVTNTRDVWPWSYLVPYFDEDIDFSVRAAHAAFARKKELNPETLPTWIPAIADSGREYFWHRETKETKWNLTDAEMADSLPFLDPYDNPLVIPLKEFAEEPIADELLNNGMTFQVLGITNYSYWPEAQAVRNCMLISPSAERKLMDFAKRRVDQMVHVSLTHELSESVLSLAARLGLKLDGPIYQGAKTVLQRIGAEKLGVFEERYTRMSQNYSAYSNVDMIDLGVQAFHWFMEDKARIRKRIPGEMEAETYWKLHGIVEQKRLVLRHIQAEILRRRKALDNDAVIPHPKMANGYKSEIIKDKLWSSFAKCNTGTKKNQGSKKYKALGNVAHPDNRRAYFTKKARKEIPKEVLDNIRKRNWLDEELYQYSLQVYDKQIQDQIKHGMFAKKLPDVITPSYISPRRLNKYFEKIRPVTTCRARK